MSATHPVRADECIALAVSLVGHAQKMLKRAEEYGLPSNAAVRATTQTLVKQLAGMRVVGEDVAKTSGDAPSRTSKPKASPKRKPKGEVAEAFTGAKTEIKRKGKAKALQPNPA